MSFLEQAAVHGRRPFTVVEVELGYCGKVYGTTNDVGMCAAAIGLTGAVKCYNTRATCQDPNNFDGASTKLYRFCSDVSYLPRDLEAIPMVKEVKVTPTQLAIGAGLGKRGEVTVKLSDGTHNDTGIDKYVGERTYDPLSQGTFLGRLLARNRYFLGRPVRIWRGYITDGPGGEPVFDFANAEKRTYFLERIEGPDGGEVRLIAKDLLKRMDDERAVAPIPSQGRLQAAITAVSAAATLIPVGIGDATDSYGRALYKASGKLRIDGEIISYTRVGDALTLTGRGLHHTTADDHEADASVQDCLEFTALPLDEIVRQLMVDYALIEASFIDTPTWIQERNTYTSGRLYTALISEPTGVNKLTGELCEQGPAYFWFEDVDERITYRALRPASTAQLELSDDAHFVKGSVRVQTRLDQRVSEIYFYFGQRDPTEKLDRVSNYEVLVVRVGQSGIEAKYGQSRSKIIYSRWLNAASRSFVEQVCDALLARYDEAPRQFDFKLSAKDCGLRTGDLFLASSLRLQGVDGLPEGVTLQVLQRGGDDKDQYAYQALEERYSQLPGEGERVISFSASVYYDTNLRTEHDSQFSAPTGPVNVRFIIDAATKMGSTSTAIPAITVGTWPEGSTIVIELYGKIQGRGGTGGSGIGLGGDGTQGATAIYTRFPIELNFPDGGGKVWAGGGGGGGGAREFIPPETVNGGGGGGGGAGLLGGTGGNGGIGQVGGGDGEDGADGTETAGGAGGSGAGGAGSGGDGGGPGLNGQDSPTADGDGGPSGYAIDGVSYVTVTGSGGDIRGPQVN